MCVCLSVALMFKELPPWLSGFMGFVLVFVLELILFFEFPFLQICLIFVYLK